MLRDENGQTWFKGNLHTHTTQSDGIMTPEDVEALYKSQGYDFIALTDHWTYTPEADYGDFLRISGIEYDFGGGDPLYGVYHTVALGHSEDADEITRESSIAELFPAIRSRGGICELAHPAWSLETPEMIMSQPRFDAVEIFNSVSDLPRNCRPDSSLILDMLALRGVFMPMLAVDDAHFYEEGLDRCRSYITVKADSLDSRSILEAVKRGDFYATQGPELYVRREGSVIFVRSSPVERITFYTDNVYIPNRSEVGEDLREASFSMRRCKFVRVEVCDKYGRRAWSNYFAK